MATAKQEMEQLLASQPEDATTEELVRELAFELMVQRGIADSEAGRTISDKEMLHRINRGGREISDDRLSVILL